MTVKLFQVDAFTREKFRGNPAIICLLEHAAEEHWMQAIAAEMNLSETAFVLPIEDGYRLRWFTPTTEIDLCGHATLAAAHTLYEIGALAGDEEARFHTRSGLLTVRKKDGLLQMTFPSEPPAPITPPPIITRLFGEQPQFVGRNRFDLLVHVRDPETVTGFVPDYYELSQLPVRGIILTSSSEDSRYDFISRFFAPRVGINEDPVTGSAHCCLGPYWADLLGKHELVAYQASSRGGELYLSIRPSQVIIAGHAVTVLRGELV